MKNRKRNPNMEREHFGEYQEIPYEDEEREEEYDSYEFERSSERKIKNPNAKYIMFVTYVFVGIFVSMLGYMVYYNLICAPETINSSYNKRQDIFAEKIVRGRILANDGTILAQTNVAWDGTETREYPYGRTFAHVLGYSAKGKAGIELNANFKLLDSHAFLLERIKNTVKGEKNIGDDVVSTLDVQLQQIAYDSLGKNKGAVIVMEPETGKILAMVSKPDYNPNEIESTWESLNEDTSGDSPLLNRATHGVYPPGSTFKIITTLAYIRQNKNYENYSYDCTSSITQDDVTINCYHNKTHGTVDLPTSFAKSCNSSFANIGLSLDKGKFKETCDSLLFNQKLSLPFSYKQSSVTISEDSDTDEVMQTSIGQGKTQMTPLHMAMITSAIANDGILMKPYLINSVQNYSGTVIKEYHSKEMAKLMTAQEAEALQKLMRGVVTDGTASKLNTSSYEAYGKTGSAEYGTQKGKSHSWYTGYATKDGKTIVTTIIMEGAGSGSEYAVPVAGKFYQNYFSR